jgi:hypothetical protein
MLKQPLDEIQADFDIIRLAFAWLIENAIAPVRCASWAVCLL